MKITDLRNEIRDKNLQGPQINLLLAYLDIAASTTSYVLREDFRNSLSTQDENLFTYPSFNSSSPVGEFFHNWDDICDLFNIFKDQIETVKLRLQQIQEANYSPPLCEYRFFFWRFPTFTRTPDEKEANELGFLGIEKPDFDPSVFFNYPRNIQFKINQYLTDFIASVGVPSAPNHS